MYKNTFLIILVAIWLAIAVYQDLKKREIENWLNFSLLIFALVYRLSYSIINWQFSFFLYGLFGLAIFFILAYLFYYSRLFAGGDAKLLIALGPALPTSQTFLTNLYILGGFIFLILFCGSIYSLFYSIFLTYRNKNKFIKKLKIQFNKKRKLTITSLLFSALLLLISILTQVYIAIPLIISFALLPFLYIYGKAVEESCMIIQTPTKALTIGDWLYEEVKIKNKTIKPNWEGLSEEEIKLLKKHKKKVKIKQGIPFSPAFFFGFFILLYILFK